MAPVRAALSSPPAHTRHFSLLGVRVGGLPTRQVVVSNRCQPPDIGVYLSPSQTKCVSAADLAWPSAMANEGHPHIIHIPYIEIESRAPARSALCMPYTRSRARAHDAFGCGRTMTDKNKQNVLCIVLYRGYGGVASSFPLVPMRRGASLFNSPGPVLPPDANTDRGIFSGRRGEQQMERWICLL